MAETVKPAKPHWLMRAQTKSVLTVFLDGVPRPADFVPFPLISLRLIRINGNVRFLLSLSLVSAPVHWSTRCPFPSFSSSGYFYHLPHCQHKIIDPSNKFESYKNKMILVHWLNGQSSDTPRLRLVLSKVNYKTDPSPPGPSLRNQHTLSFVFDCQHCDVRFFSLVVTVPKLKCQPEQVSTNKCLPSTKYLHFVAS